jgi:dipeptidyl-peptidase 4
MRIALFLLLLLSHAMTQAQSLTIQRIFADPALSGPSPRSLKISPDGKRVTFLRGKQENADQLDLWAFEVASGRTSLLVDSNSLHATSVLSDEEKARRERMRMASFSGIVEYAFDSSGGRLLFPLGGALYVYDLKQPADKAVRQITDVADGFATDPKFSPRGGFISFVREQNVYAFDLAADKLITLTHDGKDTIHNGEAEFVAQEEMNRFTGYWWAADDSAIAYEQFDESPVATTSRFEIYADRTAVVEQRYPAAGAANVLVKLAVVSLMDQKTAWMDLGTEQDIYLARVNWLPDNQRVAIQRQSRDQRTLDLLFADKSSGKSNVVLTERSDTWINLHDDLRFLKKSNAFIWASESSGMKQLQLFDLSGKKLGDLTAGGGMVENVLGLDEAAGKIFFNGTFTSPLERHIYAASLTPVTRPVISQVSVEEGFHDAVFSNDAKLYIDTFSNPNTPPQVRLHAADGKVRAVLEANKLDAQHPYGPFIAAHSAPTFGTLKAADGETDLYYRMIKPKNFDASKKYPVFLRTYGGPHAQQVAKNWDGRWGLLEQYMASRGFITFTLDNRGSARRGKKFEEALFKHMGAVEADDQRAGIEWLRSQPFVDSKKIGIFGWSYGGYMTLMMLAKHSDVLACGVAVAPVTAWESYDTHYTERYMDSPKTNADGYRDSAVFAHLKGLTSPLYLIHGMADDNVLFSNSTQLMAALQEAGTPFRLMTYPGGKHGINASAAQRLHVYNEIARYFEETLLAKAPAEK